MLKVHQHWGGGVGFDYIERLIDGSMIAKYLVISSVLTARGVPGGTVANTFDDDAYLDDVSNTKTKNLMIFFLVFSIKYVRSSRACTKQSKHTRQW